MLVSIHLTTFCQAESGWLERAIESVLSQSHRNFELICYDDASYDGTAKILRVFAERDSRVRIIRGAENLNSVSKSLGACFLAKNPDAEAVTWMFDDNVLECDALETLVTEMSRTGADVVYGQTRIMMSDGDSWLIGQRSPEAIAKSFDETSADVPNAGILVRPRVFEKSGWYDPNIIIRRSCDWDLFRRVWSKADGIVKVDRLCSTEYGELSDSSLRNSFDTSFPLMKKYVRLRDEHGFRLDPVAAVFCPSDIIPMGDWTDDELIYIYRGFVRYFVTVGNLTKGAEWSHALVDVLGLNNDLLIRNLRERFADRGDVFDAVLAGMFARREEAPLSLGGRENTGLAREAVTALTHSVQSHVSSFLRRRIRVSKTSLGKSFWRNIFRTGQFVWRHWPRVTRAI
jgi:glycosyltransferase involved in cell wall biosynthesis